jgi:hypothetical protein
VKIPNRVQLGGLTIETVYDDTLAKERGLMGQTDYNEGKILLDKTAVSQQVLEQTYLHELVHWIFHIMGEEKLRADEKLVDLFSTFLHQAIESWDQTEATTEKNPMPE